MHTCSFSESETPGDHVAHGVVESTLCQTHHLRTDANSALVQKFYGDLVALPNLEGKSKIKIKKSECTGNSWETMKITLKKTWESNTDIDDQRSALIPPQFISRHFLSRIQTSPMDTTHVRITPRRLHTSPSTASLGTRQPSSTSSQVEDARIPNLSSCAVNGVV